jgi:hypothetical protein
MSRPRIRPRPRRAWGFEALETRAVPSTLTVLNTDDAGPGSLRDAITRANALPGPDTISFAPDVTGTIALNAPLPDLEHALTIDGPGASALAVAPSRAPGTPVFGIFTVPAGATVGISGLTITGGHNSAGGGGGISNSGTLTVTDSTLSGNLAVGGTLGGGIFASQGFGGAPPVKVTIMASIFANPVGGNVARQDASISVVSLGHNLFSDTPAVPLDPTDLVSTDPLLGPLADNGGPTKTQALLPGSPAIDAGIAVPGVTTDQRGVPRPQGAAPDIGSFESPYVNPARADVAALGLRVLAPRGRWFTHQVAAFLVINPGDGLLRADPSLLRVWVNWGDGTASTGRIRPASDGSYQVVASHRYAKAGTYRTTIRVLASPSGVVVSRAHGWIAAGAR